VQKGLPGLADAHQPIQERYISLHFRTEKSFFSTGVVLGLPRFWVDLEPTAFSLNGFYGRSLPTAPDAVGIILNAQIPRESGLEAQHIERVKQRRKMVFSLEEFIGLCVVILTSACQHF